MTTKSLSIEILVDEKGAVRGFKQVGDGLDNVDAKSRGAGAGIDDTGGKFTKFGSVAGLAAGGVVVAIGAVVAAGAVLGVAVAAGVAVMSGAVSLSGAPQAPATAQAGAGPGEKKAEPALEFAPREVVQPTMAHAEGIDDTT